MKRTVRPFSCLLTWLLLASLPLLASCNTEKTIFVAPEAVPVPADASIDSLYLLPLNNEHTAVRTYLNASFPDDQHPKGLESWFLLQNLSPGQRYEVRVCWLATQPTEFWLYTYTLAETLEDPILLTSVSSYAHAHRAFLGENGVQHLQTRNQGNRPDRGLLFLRIFAAADYFTLNKTMMENVPPVFVDIILDPFLLNVFPQSLLPTAGYITALAIVAWFLSFRLVNFLQSLQTEKPHSTKKVQ